MYPWVPRCPMGTSFQPTFIETTKIITPTTSPNIVQVYAELKVYANRYDPNKDDTEYDSSCMWIRNMSGENYTYNGENHVIEPIFGFQIFVYNGYNNPMIVTKTYDVTLGHISSKSLNYLKSIPSPDNLSYVCTVIIKIYIKVLIIPTVTTFIEHIVATLRHV
jgi:hypothetical protein